MASPEGQFNIAEKVHQVYEDTAELREKRKRIIARMKDIEERVYELTQDYENHQTVNKYEVEYLRNEIMTLKQELSLIDEKLKNYFEEKTNEGGAEKQKDLEK